MDKQEVQQTTFATIEAELITISEAVFNKSTQEGLFVKNCVVNVEKATIKFKLDLKIKWKKQTIRIKNIKISSEEAKIEPQSLFFVAKKCFMTSNNCTLKSDRIRIITKKIVIKPVVF